jgi:hypothetical protein
MNSDAEWDELGTDDVEPTSIGQILPYVLASYGLGGLSMDVEKPVLCGEMAAAPVALAEVS